MSDEPKSLWWRLATRLLKVARMLRKQPLIRLCILQEKGVRIFQSCTRKHSTHQRNLLVRCLAARELLLRRRRRSCELSQARVRR